MNILNSGKQFRARAAGAFSPPTGPPTYNGCAADIAPPAPKLALPASDKPATSILSVGPQLHSAMPLSTTTPKSLSKESWENAQEAWAQGGEIYGIQRANREQLIQENNAWEEVYNYPANAAKLAASRKRHGELLAAYNNETHPQRRATLEQHVDAELAKSREAAEAIAVYRDPATKKPGQQDGPNKLWQIDSLQRTAFTTREGAQEWIRNNAAQNAEFVLKPFLKKLPSVKMRNQASILKWGDSAAVFLPGSRDKARSFFATLKAAGHSPSFHTTAKEQGLSLVQNQKTQYADLGIEKKSVSALSLEIDDLKFFFNANDIEKVQDAATTALARGKKVKVQEVEMAPGELPKPPNLLIRKNKPVTLQGGQQVPYTLPTNAPERLQTLFAQLDNATPALIKSQGIS